MSVAAALQALVDCQVSSNNILLLSRVALVADVSDMTGQRHHTAAQRKQRDDKGEGESLCSPTQPKESFELV